MSMRLVGVAMAAAIVGATPVLAQDNMQSGAGMNGGSMSSSNGMMSSSKMSKSQMATMQKCQAMSSDMMMKNRKCTSLAKKYPGMMNGGSTSSSNM